MSYYDKRKEIGCLGRLTEFRIANKLDLCHVLLTFCNEIVMPNKLKLEQYFEDLYVQSDYFEFIKRIGLDTSTMEFKKTGGEGRFSFALTNVEGIQHEFQLDNEADKRNFCKLSISVFAPKGTEACFDVSLACRQFLLCHHYRDYYTSVKEEMKLLSREINHEFYIENCTNLLELKSIVSQIENILQARLDKDIVYAYFTKLLKGRKQLQKWWESN